MCYKCVKFDMLQNKQFDGLKKHPYKNRKSQNYIFCNNKEKQRIKEKERMPQRKKIWETYVENEFWIFRVACLLTHLSTLVAMRVKTQEGKKRRS